MLIPRPDPSWEFRVGPIPLSAECCGDVEVTEDDDTVEYETVDVGGEFSGRGITRGSTFATTGNFPVDPKPRLLFVFECRPGLALLLVLDADNGLKGEYLGLKLVESGPTLGLVGLGA